MFFTWRSHPLECLMSPDPQKEVSNSFFLISGCNRCLLQVMLKWFEEVVSAIACFCRCTVLLANLCCWLSFGGCFLVRCSCLHSCQMSLGRCPCQFWLGLCICRRIYVELMRVTESCAGWNVWLRGPKTGRSTVLIPVELSNQMELCNQTVFSRE